MGHGWPVTSVDFREIPQRIVGIYRQLREFTIDAEFREERSCVWEAFEAELEVAGLTLKRFAAMDPSKVPHDSPVMRNARVG